MMKKVGIFSGAFDPVHEGHVSFALEAIKQCGLDKVFFLIEPSPRRKQGVKAFQHRVNMVNLAIENEPRLGMIILAQPKFTVPETMPILLSRFKGMQLHLLMGEDVLFKLASWPQADRLIDGVHFVIGTRQNQKELQKHIKSMEHTKGRPLSRSIFKTKLAKVNSTSIRTMLRKGEEPEGINPEVLAYIQLNGLYSPADSK